MIPPPSTHTVDFNINIATGGGRRHQNVKMPHGVGSRLRAGCEALLPTIRYDAPACDVGTCWDWTRGHLASHYCPPRYNPQNSPFTTLPASNINPSPSTTHHPSPPKPHPPHTANKQTPTPTTTMPRITLPLLVLVLLLMSPALPAPLPNPPPPNSRNHPMTRVRHLLEWHAIPNPHQQPSRRATAFLAAA
eukprot:GFKZ01010388.1.p1 GENE.GFKZ01010388.1~~GFKZ01010388.1.p1  ORF type:complete len:191 (-),score=13.56 GFKZ01010388.1:23-595(-)